MQETHEWDHFFSFVFAATAGNYERSAKRTDMPENKIKVVDRAVLRFSLCF